MEAVCQQRYPLPIDLLPCISRSGSYSGLWTKKNTNKIEDTYDAIQYTESLWAYAFYGVSREGKIGRRALVREALMMTSPQSISAQPQLRQSCSGPCAA